MLERLRSFLSGPSIPYLAALIALVLMLPALGAGRQMDDYQQTLGLRGDDYLSGPTGGLGGYFTFSDGDPVRNAELRDIGVYPWWMPDVWRLNFFRPLSVMTHWLDEALWPETIWLHHAHSIGWHVLSVLLQGWVFRRLMGPTWGAGLATLIVGANDQLAWAVCWIANRNSMIALCFGCAAILCHLRWRESRAPLFGGLAVLMLFLGLMAKESTAVVGTYLLAYELFLRDGGLLRRFLHLVPYIVLGMLWWGYYKTHGYGMAGAGLYVDPSDAPLFLDMLLLRGPMYLISSVGFFVTDAIVFTDPSVWPKYQGYCVVWMVLLGALLWPLLRQDAQLRFWLLGTAFAVVPACSSYPSDRATEFAAFGGAGLTARAIWLALAAAAASGPRPVWRHGMRALIIAWLLSAFIWSPLCAYGRINAFDKFTESIREPAVELELKSPEVTHLICVNVPGPLFEWHLWTIRRLEGLPMPPHAWTLMTGFRDITLTRNDERTLTASIEEGLLRHPVAKLFRDQRHPFHPGDQVALTGCTIEVLEVASEEDGPTRVRFRFDRSLDDPVFDWRQWERGRYVPFTMPAAGESVLVPRQVRWRFWAGRDSLYSRIVQWLVSPDLEGEQGPMDAGGE